MQADLLISGMAVYAEQGIVPAATLRIENQVISGIFAGTVPAVAVKTLSFPANYHLIPGRIDMHIHGARGADVMDATPAAIGQISAALAAEGVTGFLATTITESVTNISKALYNIACYSENPHPEGAEILGIHLEGPFIAAQQAGAHRKELLLLPDIKLFNQWQQAAGGRIKLVTVAPELPGGIEFIRYLAQQGVLAAIGHTDADFAVTQLAIAAGARHATHLFNAMRAFHHREPGCLAAILLDSRVRAELIVDGQHLHPAALQLALSLKGVPGLMLVTDAMRAKCCGAGDHFELGGQTVIVADGAARLSDGTLAGSILTMTQAVKNMLRFSDCTLMDIIHLTSSNPAKMLQIHHRTGSLALGKDADLTVLDEHLEVVLTLAKGRIIYQRGFSC